MRSKRTLVLLSAATLAALATCTELVGSARAQQDEERRCAMEAAELFGAGHFPRLDEQLHPIVVNQMYGFAHPMLG